ncbi:serine hydroxymethyltransferase, partial [Mesorhizobium sp. M0040]
EIERSLLEGQVVTNKNPIPFDTLPPSKAGGLRIGSAALTTRGFNEEQFFELGVMIGKVVTSTSKQDIVADLRAFVKTNTQGLPLFNRNWVA